MWEKKWKIQRTRLMTKKKVIRNLYPENGHFSKIFFGPPKFGARSPPMRLESEFADAFHNFFICLTAIIMPRSCEHFKLC